VECSADSYNLQTVTEDIFIFGALEVCYEYALYKFTQTLTFLQRVSIACYAERCTSYDRFCLTVRPSVTRCYHAKTTPATIMQS